MIKPKKSHQKYPELKVHTKKGQRIKVLNRNNRRYHQQQISAYLQINQFKPKKTRNNRLNYFPIHEENRDGDFQKY